jgi:hypothetical protein
LTTLKLLKLTRMVTKYLVFETKRGPYTVLRMEEMSHFYTQMKMFRYISTSATKVSSVIILLLSLEPFKNVIVL